MKLQRLVEQIYGLIFAEEDEELTYNQKLLLVLFSVAVSTWILVIIIRQLVHNTLYN